MKAIYTEAAKAEVEAFKRNQQMILERLICEEKTVFGDDVLEITASDVRTATGKIGIHPRHSSRQELIQVMPRIYIAGGLLLMMAAFFLPALRDLYETSRVQGNIFLTGALMTSVGVLVSAFINNRRKRSARAEAALQYLREGQAQDSDPAMKTNNVGTIRDGGINRTIQ